MPKRPVATTVKFLKAGEHIRFTGNGLTYVVEALPYPLYVHGRGEDASVLMLDLIERGSNKEYSMPCAREFSIYRMVDAA